MKNFLLLFAFTSFLFCFPLFSYSQVERVRLSGSEVVSERENLMLHRYTDTILDYEGVQPNQIQCLKNALLLTGFFEDVSIDFVAVDERFKQAWIKPVWRKDWDKAVIREIIFKGYQGLDRNRLYKKLAVRGLRPGAPFCSFSEINAYAEIRGIILEEVESLVKENATQDSDEKDDDSQNTTEPSEELYPIVWIGVEKITGDDIRLVVSSSYECK
jgi:hypothetical protein